jgi:hypothetical protein
MIGALVKYHIWGRGIIIDMLVGWDGETKYLIFLDQPADWGQEQICTTIWAPNENTFEVLSEA